MKNSKTWWTLLLITSVMGCGNDGPDASHADTGDASVADASMAVDDTSQETVSDPGDLGEAETGPPSTDGETATGDAEQPLTPLETRNPMGEAPTDPLADTDLESCAVYQEERCVDTVQQSCLLVDGATGAAVETPDPVLHRALLFDRWYDLYHQPDGQTVERHFKGATSAGTPESEWGALEHFSTHGGAGDSAIWTGVSLVSAALRYRETGTAADYARMATKVRALLTMFDVTGVPGHLARYHYLNLPPEAPRSDAHIFHYDDPSDNDHRDRPISAPESVQGLPSVYLDGVTAEDGTTYTGTPMWHGNPSIDQYTGPMVAFPLVYHLLQDESLKERIVTHLTCYLKRLRRIEIHNIQSYEGLSDALASFFGGGGVALDPDDFDLTTIDTVVAYALPQLNTLNEASYPMGCPDTIQLEPHLVLDATNPGFPIELLALAQEIQSKDNESANGLDHIYVPSIRGGDAMHMMHLAAMAYHFTGDELYREFFQDELVDTIGTAKVIKTMGSLQLPRWCKAFYGDHITFPATWAAINLLGDGPVRDALLDAMESELWSKSLSEQGNAKFNLMYASVLDQGATGWGDALSQGVTAVSELGGNGGVLDDPRRTYDLDAAELIANMPEGIEAICPTEEERALCEDGFDVLGIEIPGETITGECTDAAWDCPMTTGCATKMASQGMPMAYRVWSDFIWQRNPFVLGDTNGSPGSRQSPGLDLTESYWLARATGFITEGKGHVLAWTESGTCESPLP